MTRIAALSPTRLEDTRLLEGRGRFTDDIRLAGLLEAHVLRSPHAHARIRTIDLQAARAHPEVFAVWIFDDLGEIEHLMPMIIPDRRIVYPKTQEVLARSFVHYVGQPVAFIVASNRYVAEDVAELIHVEYEPLGVVSSLRDAAAAHAPLVHEDAQATSPGPTRWRLETPIKKLRQRRM